MGRTAQFFHDARSAGAFHSGDATATQETLSYSELQEYEQMFSLYSRVQS